MKTLKLLSLNLHNFKGIQDFTLDTHSDSLRIMGDNATGKTTVFDAFVWLLFDKDSNNKKDFQIKTVDAHGNELHNLDHEVEGTFLLNGHELSLKKVYKEKWTKKRGSASKEFSGHTTDYYIDGVPSKKKEYNDKVAEIIDEKVFKLLTSPSYFNEHMGWKERRDTLLEVAGDVSDGEVISSNNNLTKLLDVLGNRSIDDHKKVIAAKRKEINKRLDVIPELIAEVERNKPEVNENKESLEKEIASIQHKIDEKQEKINSLNNGSEVSNLKKQLSDIDLELSNIKQEHDQQGKEELFKLRTSKQEEESNIQLLNGKISTFEQLIQSNQQRITDYRVEMDNLREEWKDVDQEEFTHDEDCNCPTCGQELPEEQIQSAREKALNEFNQKKANKLQQIKLQGQDRKMKVEKLLADNQKHQTEITQLETEIKKKEDKVQKLNGKIAELEQHVTDVSEVPEYQSKLKERQEVEKQIKDAEANVYDSVQTIKQEIGKHQLEQQELRVKVSEIDTAERSQKRIKELEDEEKRLAAEFEQLEEELYLADEFIRTKVNMLEEKINSKFKYAHFKLFTQLNHGGLEETCETLFKGVPYSSGLNNAARINVGLDIINTLSKHYGFEAPIFIDNAEAVTELIDTNAQTISLVVSEKDKELRIESPEQAQREAV
ncbi:AAA family ATPase [Piscibacillus sp. B03]|uniref:AAA family ATPase n=1 Tax=Piscibacillus sp. B03 TaxID=3457430 RepID=UPI003FCE3897